METEKKSLAIVGGGASGLACAIAAGDYAQSQGESLAITIYEKDDRVGRTILATGNGRCNFSNSSLDWDAYHNAPFVKTVVNALGLNLGKENPVEDFFANLGLVWREEGDGRLFPLANKASVVLDVLRAAAKGLGVKEICESTVAAIDAPKANHKPFTLRMNNGVLKRAGAVVMACGGHSLSALEAVGFPRVTARPILGPLAVEDNSKIITRELDNIRVKATVSLYGPGKEAPVATESGELLFRKYGVSGICVFNLSRLAKPGQKLAINFLKGRSAQEVQGLLEERFAILSARYGALTYGDLLRGLLLPRVTDALVKSRFVNPYNHISEKDIPTIAELLVAFPLEVEGIADPALCQSRRGGFAVEAFDAQTLQAKDTPGLYGCGEALDVDGPCGGYNLHWAWASGMAAGRGAAARLLALEGEA